MIDCGATGEAFANKRFVSQHKIPTTPLPKIQELVGADGHHLEDITHTITVKLTIGDHVETITMFVADIGNYSIILGVP